MYHYHYDVNTLILDVAVPHVSTAGINHARDYKVLFLIVLFASICILSNVLLPSANAQASTPDTYEENDTLNEASNVPHSVVLPNLTISPGNDPDYYRFIAVPGPLNIEI